MHTQTDAQTGTQSATVTERKGITRGKPLERPETAQKGYIGQTEKGTIYSFVYRFYSFFIAFL